MLRGNIYANALCKTSTCLRNMPIQMKEISQLTGKLLG